MDEVKSYSVGEPEGNKFWKDGFVVNSAPIRIRF